MASDRLRREIESLLRWPMRGGISTHLRGPVLGSRSSAPVVPLYRADLWRYCESGLLRWNALTPYSPLRVYVGDRLDVLRHPPTTDGWYESASWATGQLDASYPDILNPGYTDRPYWPSFWSGLGRLVIQGCHGRKRDPREIFGSAIDNSRQGVWFAGGGYWLVNISSSVGVTVQALLPDVTNDFVHSALAQLGENGLTDAQRSTALACVLSSATPSGSVTEILAPSAIEAVWEKGQPLVPVHGWKFCRGQPLASIVTFTEECMPEYLPDVCIGQFVTSLWTITAELTDGVWSCEITESYAEVRSRPYTSRTSIYVPTYGALASNWDMAGKVPGWGDIPLNINCCYAAIGDSVQALDCYYDSDDVLQIAWYIQHQPRVSSVNTLSDDPVCTGSFAWSGQVGDDGYWQGGFAVSATQPSVEDFRDDYKDYEERSYSVTLTPGAWGNWIVGGPSTYMGDLYAATATFCTGGEINDFVSANYGNLLNFYLRAKSGTHEENISIQSFTSNPRLWTFVVSPWDCEAFYILDSGKSETTSDKLSGQWSGTTYPNGLAVYGGQVQFNLYSRSPWNELMLDVTKTDLARSTVPETYMYGSWYGMTRNLLGWDDCTTVSEEGDTVSQAPQNRLFTPSGTIELSPSGQYGSFFPESILDGFFIDGQPLRAVMSWLGDGLYYDGEGVVVSGVGGYQADPGLEGFFIGGA